MAGMIRFEDHNGTAYGVGTEFIRCVKKVQPRGDAEVSTIIVWGEDARDRAYVPHEVDDVLDAIKAAKTTGTLEDV